MTGDSVPLKRCTKCKQSFPATLEYFPSHKGKADGLSSRCKPCINAAQRERRIHPPIPIPDGYKRCSVCKQVFPKTTEYFYTHGPHRLHSECKECMKTAQRKHPVDHLPEGYKRCTKCKEIKPATREYFYPQKAGTHGLEPSCKVCRKAFLAHVPSNTPEKRLAYSRKYEAQPNVRATRKRYTQSHSHRKFPLDILPEGCKRCTVCKGVFPATRKYFSGAKAHGKRTLKGRCRECERRSLRESPTYNRSKRVRVRNRAVHKKAVQGTHTAAQVDEQLKRQHYRCYYAACGFAKFPRIRKNGTWEYVYEVEHTFPISRVVGTDIPANDMSYLVLSCESCNGKKGSKFPWEWFEGGRLL